MSRLTLGISGVTSGNRYNVPTGLTHQLTINSVNVASLGATGFRATQEIADQGAACTNAELLSAGDGLPVDRLQLRKHSNGPSPQAPQPAQIR